MWDAALIALARFADPLHMGMLMAGVLAGTVIGILPGLGGIACVAILLPFIYTLDVHTAMILSAPDWCCGSEDERLSNMKRMCPPSRSFMAGAVPR